MPDGSITIQNCRDSNRGALDFDSWTHSMVTVSYPSDNVIPMPNRLDAVLGGSYRHNGEYVIPSLQMSWYVLCPRHQSSSQTKWIYLDTVSARVIHDVVKFSCEDIMMI